MRTSARSTALLAAAAITAAFLLGACSPRSTAADPPHTAAKPSAAPLPTADYWARQACNRADKAETLYENGDDIRSTTETYRALTDALKSGIPAVKKIGLDAGADTDKQRDRLLAWCSNNLG